MLRLFKLGRRITNGGYLVAGTLLILAFYAAFGFLASKIPKLYTDGTAMVTLPGGVDVPAGRMIPRKEEEVEERRSGSERRRIWLWLMR
jgi:hypothetical protein